MTAIDAVDLAFDAQALTLLQIILGLVMFGVALDLRVRDFRALAENPRAPLAGLVAQLLLLPGLTTGLAALLPIPPSVALGMILVGSCPGGNVSNFITQVGGGRIETSVGMTAVTTLSATVTTPLWLGFWGAALPSTGPLLQQVHLSPVDMLWTVGVLLGVPVLVGMLTAEQLPRVAAWLRRPMKVASLAFFVLFVAIAFRNNIDHFLAHIHTVFWPVALMNGMALSLGWLAASSVGADVPDRRAVAIEVGIQNSGLGLVLVFAFFDGLGGMAVTCAWWGIWHILAGLSLAGWWTWRDRRSA